MSEHGQYVYIRSEPNLWTAGFYRGGLWEPESDHASPETAAARVHWLNGGRDTNAKLLTALEALEWSGFEDCEGTGFMGSGPTLHPRGHPACPVCHGLNPQQKYSRCFNKTALGHRPRCTLDAALKEAKGQ